VAIGALPTAGTRCSPASRQRHWPNVVVRGVRGIDRRAMSACVYNIDQLPARHVEGWDNALQSRTPIRTPFLSHLFCKMVARVKGGVSVLVVDDGGNGASYLPFQMKRYLLGHAEKVGGEISDYFGFAGQAPTDREPPELLNTAGLAALRFDHAPDAIFPFRGVDVEHTAGIKVCIENYESFTKHLELRNKEFIRLAERRKRRLIKDLGQLTFTWNDTDPAHLAFVIARKREQYARTGVADALSDEWKRKLLHALAGSESDLCRMAVSSVHAGGTWLASNICLLCADTAHIWFSVYDQAYNQYGPGHLLFLNVFEHGAARGYRCFDFGQGVSPYKAQYRGEEYGLRKGVLRANSVLGSAERLIQSVKWRLEHRPQHRALRAV
jgi:CelD/BcsL family acetyltransferase involved in cellulose biosynthesis